MRFAVFLAAVIGLFVGGPAQAVAIVKSFQAIAYFTDDAPAYEGDGHASVIWFDDVVPNGTPPGNFALNLQFRTVAGGSNYIASVICCDGETEAIRLNVLGNQAHGVNLWLAAFDLTHISTYTPEFLDLFGGDVLAAKDGLYAGFLATSADFRLRSISNPAFDATGAFLPPAVGTVPEPSTWALMLLGIGFAGAAMRRARTRSPHCAI